MQPILEVEGLHHPFYAVLADETEGGAHFQAALEILLRLIYRRMKRCEELRFAYSYFKISGSSSL